MNKGRTHLVNTFARYGGIQAEMETVRHWIVQVDFRSSYGLHYQPVRRGRGGDIIFCSDLDAYDVNAMFRRSIDTFVQMLHGACRKSFGAQDEMRGSGMVVRDALDDVAGLVRLAIFSLEMLSELSLPRCLSFWRVSRCSACNQMYSSDSRQGV